MLACRALMAQRSPRRAGEQRCKRACEGNNVPVPRDRLTIPGDSIVVCTQWIEIKNGIRQPIVSKWATRICESS
jgi:hypothetical protein